MAATVFSYQTIGSALGSAWTTETDKVWTKIIDRLGLPLYAEIAVANPNSAKETTYDDYQRVRIADGDTSEYIFYGKVESTTPIFDPEFGQILLIRAKDNSQELLKRTINSRYTGYTLRSNLIEQMIIDHSYVNVTKNIDTTTAAKFEDSAVTEAANNLDVDYRKSGKSVLSAIAELAREDPWDTSKTGFSYDYYLDAVFSGNTPTPFMHYFKRGSRPAGGASANGLTVEYALATETDQARMMLPDYSFSTSGGELVTKVRIEYTDLNGASQNKIVHLLATSANVGTFTVGETITGAGLPASITVEFVGSGFLIVTWSSTVLTAGGTITGGSSGATRVLDSVPRQTLQQDVEVVLRDYHSEDIDKARARAAELLYKRGDTVTRGEFGIIRWPHFTIAAVTTIVRAGHVVRVINSNSSVNSDMLVVGIEYDEGPGSFGARLEVIGSARGEGINPGIIEALKNQTDQGNIQNIGAVGGLPFNAQFCEFTPELNLHAAATQLNGALTDSATTITVDSTTEFASSGTIFIEAERITYTGKTATTFTGCTRGVDGGGGGDGGATTNVAHDDNITVVSPERVVWDATTCTYADGRTQAISAGSFTMTDNSAVYWVIETVETATLSVVSGFTTAVGITKHPLAICQMNYSTGKADIIMTHTTDPKITTGFLIANQLSSFTADLGKITAGAIKLPSTSQNIIDATELVGFTGFTLNGDRIAGYNAGTLQVEIRSSDGKLYAGGGGVIIDVDGISIDNAIGSGLVRFIGVNGSAATSTDWWIGRTGAGVGNLNLNAGDSSSAVRLQNLNNPIITAGSTSIVLRVNAGADGWTFDAQGLEFDSNGSAGDAAGFYINRVSGNLNLNGGTTGEVRLLVNNNTAVVAKAASVDLRVTGGTVATISSIGIIPGAASTYDLGTSSTYWEDVYLETVQFPASITLPAGTIFYIGVDAANDLYLNTTTGNTIAFTTNNSTISWFEASGLQLNGTALQWAQDDPGFPAGTGRWISSNNSGDVVINVPSTKAVHVYVNGVDQFGFAAGGLIYAVGAVPIAGNFFYIYRDTNDDFIYNIDAGNIHQFRVNGTAYVQLSAAGIGVGSSIAPTGNGVNIGAASTNNDIWNASQGAGTATLYIGNVSITTSSDIRLKKDIASTSITAYDLFRQLKVVDFTWNDPSDQAPINKNSRGRWTGLIAQEMIDVVPWIVNAPDRHCLECRSGVKCLLHDSYWSVDLQHMAGLFVKGFQETDNRIEALEKEVSRLKNSLGA